MRQLTKGCMPKFPYKRLYANASRTKIVPHVQPQENRRGKMVALFSSSSFTAPTAKQLPSRRNVPLPILSSHKQYFAQEWPKLLQRLSLHALASTLSFGLILPSPPPSLSLHPPIPQSPPITTNTTTQFCQDDGDDFVDEIAPESVTNEGIVEEAWQIVNDTFIDAGHHRWSPEMWLQKREDILGTSIPTRSRAHDIIRRMLASLGDPYTRFLSPTEFSKMARYDVTGVGINLRETPDVNGGIKLKVLGIILDGPAHSAGIRQGDEILSVNGVDIKGKSSFEVSSMLQGPNETFVTIEVKHGNCGPTQSYQVQRQVIARTPVFYRLEPIENGTASVGYIRLKEFNALARKDLVIAMKQLRDSGASYFVLDLRGNLGGLVQAGIEVAKLFLDKGETVTYTVGRDPQFQRTIVADASPLVTAPVIIVVNNRTASASEIVATALHDNCRAVLVGDRTFGKGLIQSVFELHDGSGVVVTVGKYVTPNHMDINGNGVEPDFPRTPAWSTVTKHLMQCNIQRRR